MRYVLMLLLLSGVCRAQDEFEDYVRVTGYKIIEEYDDGPCSIVSYLKEEGIGNYVSAIQSKNKTLAMKLVALKKEATKHWPSEKRTCMKGWIGLSTIPHMLVIEINAYRDTIFTTKENKAIYLFDEQKEYYDKKGELRTILPKDFNDFFDKSPLTARGALTTNELDSINVNKITFGNKQIYGLTRTSFEKEFGKFFTVTATIDSVPDISTSVSYSIYNSTIQFKDNYHAIEQLSNYFPSKGDGYTRELFINIGGILPGDAEKVLKRTLPASSKHKFYKGKKTAIEELEDDYYYDVKIADNKGYVSFRIIQGIIKDIVVEFYYRFD